jgi:hypothetical protein
MCAVQDVSDHGVFLVSKDRLKVFRQAVCDLIVPLLCAVAAWRLGQDTSWDLRNYHFYNGYAFLNDRHAIDMAPAGLQTWLNPWLDVFWYALHRIFPPPVVGIILGFLHGLNFLLIYRIAQCALPAVRWHQTLAWGLGVAGVLSVGFRSELGTTMHDNLVSLFILAAVWLVMRARQYTQLSSAWKWLICAGLLAGCACALKLVVSVYALGLCFAILAVKGRWRDRFIGATLYSTGVCLGLLLAGGYWFWSNWQLFHNPIFPLFNDFFGGELANAIEMRDVRFLPRSAGEYVIYPFLMTFDPGRVSEVYFIQFSWLAIYILLIVTGTCVLLRRMRSVAGVEVAHSSSFTSAGLLLVWFFCFSYLLWLHLFGIYRYLMPIELLLPSVLVVTSSVLSKRAFIPAVFAVAILTAANMRSAPDFGHSEWGQVAAHVDTPEDSAESGTILLLGQPLGWLVAAMDLPIPFLQIWPNFSADESRYTDTVLDMIDRTAPIRVIFDPRTFTSNAATEIISSMGYMMVASECQALVAYLGSQPFNYQYCPVTP